MNTKNCRMTELLNSSDPEKLVRKRCRSSMAAMQQDDPCRDQQEASNVEEDEGPYRGDIPHFYIPDLASIILSEAIKGGMMLGTSGREYMILTPNVKDYIGVKTLKVKIPSGELEIPKNPTSGLCHEVCPKPFWKEAPYCSFEGTAKCTYQPTIHSRRWLAHYH